MVRRLGESSPQDKGTCRKTRSRDGAGWGFSLAALPASDAHAPFSTLHPDARTQHFSRPLVPSTPSLLVPAAPPARKGGPPRASPSCSRASAGAGVRGDCAGGEGGQCRLRGTVPAAAGTAPGRSGARAAARFRFPNFLLSRLSFLPRPRLAGLPRLRGSPAAQRGERGGGGHVSAGAHVTMSPRPAEAPAGRDPRGI